MILQESARITSVCMLSCRLTRVGGGASGRFAVGAECPYFKDGYTVAEAVLDGDGAVVALLGLLVACTPRRACLHRSAVALYFITSLPSCAAP